MPYFRHSPAFFSRYHHENKIPASGDSTTIIIEKVKDSIEISVALCSEGNISCRIVLVLTCKVSSPNAAINPPNVINRQMPECSNNNPKSTSAAVKANTFPYFGVFHFKMTFAPRIPPISIKNKAAPRAQFGIPAAGSFACRKNKSRMSIAPTRELQNIRAVVFFSFFRKDKLERKHRTNSDVTD